MRRILYGGAISIDGFLAGPNEEIDWLRYSGDSRAQGVHGTAEHENVEIVKPKFDQPGQSGGRSVTQSP